MSEQEGVPEAQPDVAGSRPFRVRVAVAATFAAFVAVGLSTPGALLPALAGGVFAAIVLVALGAARGERRTSLAVRETRRRIWPEAAIRSVGEAFQFPVYVLDAAGALRFANKAALATFGPAAIGDPIGVTFRRPEVARLVARSLAEATRQSAEYADTVPSERWFKVDIAPAPQPAGKPEFFVLSFQDLTEARRAEQMRSDFIANASHELRTPLASLRGFIETIQGPAAQDPKAMARFLDIMLDQAERMSRLIDDLLSLSRIEMKAHVRPQGRVKVQDVLGNVIGALQPLADRLEVTILREIPEEPMFVNGDRDELIQVFANLVENACKYGQSGGRVELSALPLEPVRPDAPRRVEIAVRDYGPGIAAEHLPRLTERFYRVDVGSSRQKQGTGLGLAIVKHILNRHGAKLVVSSTQGEGSRFGVTLPLLAPES